MARIFRISNAEGNLVGTADCPEAIGRVIERLRPGRYHVSEASSDPSPEAHAPRRWGSALKEEDGTIALEPDNRN
jgi:hypothetical protein